MKTPGLIVPTVGRVLWYWREPPKEGTQAEAATVAFVHNERLVNLHVIDHNGVGCSVTSVTLRQPDDAQPGSNYCEWMPYQMGQAARTEAAEAKAGGAVNNLATHPTPTPNPPDPVPPPPGEKSRR